MSLLRRERLHNPASDVGAHIRIANVWAGGSWFSY
jgi:hypothetical protein